MHLSVFPGGGGPRLPFGLRLRWRRLRTRILALAALGAFLVAAGVLVAAALRDEERSVQAVSTTTAAPTTVAPTVPPAAPKPVLKPVRLTAAGPYDPFGDDHENDDEVGRASDGDRSTYWSTERYDSWFKEGVGLVLDAGRPVRLATVRVATETPGFRAEVRAALAPEGPFTRISRSQTVGANTVFELRAARPAQYVLIWITQLGATPREGGAVRINEVRATASEPARS